MNSNVKFTVFINSTILLLAVFSFGPPLSARAASAPELITTNYTPGVSGAGNSFAPVMSGDGRFVLFVSHANNLVTNDSLNPHLDLFLRDRVVGTTTLLSVDRSGIGGGRGDSGYASISTNGRYVAFASYATNLIANDTNLSSDIFLRDLQSGNTILVSATPSGGVSPSRAESVRPVMTPDARWIVFESDSRDLATGATGLLNLFWRDVQTGATSLISTGGISRRTYSPSISHNGQRIAFVSTTDNLVPGYTNRSGDVYVRDVPENRMIWVGTEWHLDKSFTFAVFAAVWKFFHEMARAIE